MQRPVQPPLQFRACAGFANRFRALASAMCAAEDVGRGLEVFWQSEPGVFVGPFYSLFRVTPQLPVGPLRPIILDAGAPSGRQEIMLNNQQDWDKYAAALKVTSPTQPPHPLKSFYRFHTADDARWLSALRSWRPREEHELAVERLLAHAAGRPLIGIHIRRGDNRISVERSPTHLFLKAMNEQLVRHPNTVFFLASDDEQERRNLQTLYGSDTILTMATQIDRHTTHGGADAFRDFLALSKCHEIWGSAYSSFSEVASAYGGCPLKILQSAVQA